MRAKKEKPVVSAFISGKVSKMVSLKPDLIIGFSDIQANLAKELIENNQQVLIFNQRSLQDILDYILVLGRLVGAEKKATLLVKDYMRNLQKAHEKTTKQKFYHKVYFEEWNDPMISCIQWVSELIVLAGGKNIFSDRSKGKLAKERFVKSAEVIQKNPDIYIGSWCGKKMDKQSVLNRAGWQEVSAIKNDQIFEIDSSIILQPGPACLTDGLEALEKRIRP